MKSRQDIGTKIKLRRRELKLSQEELADLAGVARQTVSAWERNFFVPKGENLVVLGRVLKAPISFFVDESPALDGESPGLPQGAAMDAPASFELAPFARLYDYAQTRAHTSTQGSRAEAIRILRLTIIELERADAPELEEP